MKKMILAASLLSMLVITLPGWADEAHRPGTQAAPATMGMNMAKMNTLVQQMQEMRKKIETEKDPARQKNLMHQHMRMMQAGMNMMIMMTSQGGTMMGSQGMMEKKMMIQEMLNGMMTQQKMMMKNK